MNILAFFPQKDREGAIIRGISYPLNRKGSNGLATEHFTFGNLKT
jgi:hypothetical protein